MNGGFTLKLDYRFAMVYHHGSHSSIVSGAAGSVAVRISPNDSANH